MTQKRSTLKEELARFKSINKYYLVSEQEAPMDEPTEELPMDGEAPTEELPMDGEAPIEGELPMDDATAPPTDDTMMGDEGTEEIDITDLVNMTKSIKNDLDDRKKDEANREIEQNNVFRKLDDFEQSFKKLDALLMKIDALDTKIETIKEPTPVEKLEMRSLDSYPFNEKPEEFFNHKQDEMRASGKNEYVLTKEKIQNYSPEQIIKSFNVDDQVDNRF